MRRTYLVISAVSNRYFGGVRTALMTQNPVL